MVDPEVIRQIRTLSALNWGTKRIASELGIARAGLSSDSGAVVWVTAIALVLVVVIAAALVDHTSRMLLGNPTGEPDPA